MILIHENTQLYKAADQASGHSPKVMRIQEKHPSNVLYVKSQKRSGVINFLLPQPSASLST